MRVHNCTHFGIRCNKTVALLQRLEGEWRSQYFLFETGRMNKKLKVKNELCREIFTFTFLGPTPLPMHPLGQISPYRCNVSLLQRKGKANLKIAS